MKRIRLASVTVTVVCGLMSLAATGAWAEGPLWLVNGQRFDCEKVSEGARYKTLLECLGGERSTAEEKWERKELTGTSGHLLTDQVAPAETKKSAGSGNFVLRVSTLITFECTTLSAPTNLVGGTPAKSHVAITLSGCSVAGKTEAECHVNSAGKAVGTIVTNVKTEVLYIGTKEEAKKEEGNLGDLIEPEAGAVFTTLEVLGTSCPVFSEGTNKLEGSVIGEVSPVNAMGKAGAVKFPSPTINKGWRWVKKGEVSEVKPSLKLFGFINLELTGEAAVELESGAEWGVITH
jgi:hypothetical protein